MLVLILGFSCNNEPLDVKIEEASFMSNLQAKGQPPKTNFFKGGTASQDIVIDGAGFNLEFKNFGEVKFDHNAFIYFTNYFYMRRETLPSDPFNYRFLEETSDRDLLMTVSNISSGRGTRLFLDGNPDSSNFELISSEGNAGSSGFRGNNAWFIPEQLKTYETIEDAHANGVIGWFKTSKGVIMTTK